MACANGWEGRLAFGSTQLHFINADIGFERYLADNNDLVITGSPYHKAEQVALGAGFVRGSILMQPTPGEWDVLLPWMFGAAESSDTFVLGNGLREDDVYFDAVGTVFLFGECYVDKWAVFGRGATPSSPAPSHIYLKLDIIGKTCTADATFPTATLSNQQPFLFNEGNLTLDAGANRKMDQFQIAGDNMLRMAFDGGLTPQRICRGGQMTTLYSELPFLSADKAIITSHLASAAGAAASLAFTKGGQSQTWTFGNIKHLPLKTPGIKGKAEEIRMPVRYKAYSTGATPVLSVVNDSVA